MGRMLVSFQHSVAALIDRRVLLINCAVCEDMFQATTEVTAKQVVAESPELATTHPAAIADRLKDFPLMIRVLSLGDGVEIAAPPELIVKWSNIAAICNMSDEQWVAIRKPPRKQRGKKVQP